jgi:hypothetical protein
MTFAHKLIIVFLTALLVTTSVFAQTDTTWDWDGVWSGNWAKDMRAKIVISGQKVIEYSVQGKKVPGVQDTSISGNVLKFKVGETVITIGRLSPTGAYAHSMTGTQEATAGLTRE